ncbi:glycosyltransferase family 2 protein [Ancylobacter sp. Lp-2]|uniref:glycosyltransferase family A protein n=1 Tax=Ancylobacter sp. Lp-2 TaxID=2881339 RepID=UPI001E5A7077|nr:glycosyltransferase family A protein [Ancylobacter sp. Lp-2]MCB4769811.1 glycosyltransferase family 2 protein [Ancylobacter sp. Lp-2]
MLIKGDVNGVRPSGEIWGWLLDADSPDTTLIVRVSIAGYEFEIPADVHRPDIAKGFGGHGNHGFVFVPPPSIPPGQHEVEIAAAADGSIVPRGQFALNVGERDGRLRARIATFTAERITGWAYDSEDLAQSLVLQMFVDHKPAKDVACDVVRKDVDGQAGNALRVGFHTGLPLEFWDGETHRLTLKESRTGRLIHDGWLRTDPTRILVQGRALHGEVAEFAAAGISGWVTDMGRPLTVELEIDGILVARQEADQPVQLDRRRNAGFRFNALPAAIFDDAEHAVAVHVLAGERAVLGARKVKFAKADAPRLVGEVETADAGRLAGWAIEASAPELALELSLVVDGVEVQTVVTRPGGEPRGRFEFALPAGAAVDNWLASRIEVANLARGLTLALDGRNPVVESLRARLEPAAGGGHALVLTSGAPIPARVKVELLEDQAVRHSLELAVADDPFAARGGVGRLDADKVLARLTHVRIGGHAVPLAGVPGVAETATPAQGSPGRSPGAALPTLDPRVRRRLSDLARGEVAPEGDAARPDYAGVWRFAPPAIVEGWAVDLANPADPLEIELLIDGTPVLRGFASQPVQPREAQFGFELPVGFRFDLSSLNLRKASLALVEARVVGGGTLVPGRPQVVDLAGIRVAVGRVGEIDALVAAGRVADAYLVARSIARGGGRAALHRFLALDFALRARWHDYEAFLASWGEGASRAFLTVLQDAWRLRVVEGKPDSVDLAARGELPAAYAPLLAAVAPAAPLDPGVAFDAAALWLTLEQLSSAEEGPSAPGEVAVVVPRAALGEEERAHLVALAGLGCRVISAAEAPAQDTAALARFIEASAKGARCFVVLREPRRLPASALGYWPRLAATGGTGIASLMRFADAAANAVSTGLLPREPDAAVRICADSATAAAALVDDGAAAAPVEAWDGPEFPVGLALAVEAAYAEPSCVVVHDVGPEVALTLPAGARVVAAGDDVAATLAGLAGDGLPPATPVVVMSRQFQYPPDYVPRCRREFIMAGERSVVTSALRYAPASGEFTLTANSPVPTGFLGLRARGCYRLSDLVATDRRFPGAAAAGLVMASEHPFRLVGEGDSALALVNDATARPLLRQFAQDVTAREMGFAAHVLENWAGAAESVGMMQPPSPADDVALVSALGLGLEATAERRQAAGFFPRLEDCARRGHLAVVEGYLRACLAQPAELLRLDDEALLGLIGCCKALGLQVEAGRALHLNVAALAARSPDLVLPLFEIVATALPPADVTAVLMAAASDILPQPQPRAAARLVTACRRYASPLTMALLVGMIERSGHRDLLGDADVAATVGAALAGGEDTTLGAQDEEGAAVRFTPPLVDRLIAALLAGEADRFARLLNIYFAERRDPGRLLAQLRTYTYEITRLGVPAGAVRYPPDAAPEQMLALAILLDDQVAIRHLDGARLDSLESTNDPHGIVAASYRHNMKPLERAFARWGLDHGVAPLSFAGDSIGALFENFAGQPLPPAAVVDHGRVSVIVTVYNPELPLLAAALESLTRQTYRNLEIILVDDASDEVASAAIEELAARDPRIVFLRQSRNGGPYAARNRALEVAIGDFIAIHDGDDYAHPQRLEVQVGALARSPILKLCTTAHLRIDRLARLQFEHTLDLLGDGTMTSLFRREVFEVIGGFAPVRSRGDVEFRERLEAAYGAHVHVQVGCPLTFCYATPVSLSNAVARRLPEYLALFREAFDRRVRVPVLGGQRVAATADGVPIPWPLRAENRLAQG